jgi:hypothetical protein
MRQRIGLSEAEAVIQVHRTQQDLCTRVMGGVDVGDGDGDGVGVGHNQIRLQASGRKISKYRGRDPTRDFATISSLLYSRVVFSAASINRRQKTNHARMRRQAGKTIIDTIFA